MSNSMFNVKFKTINNIIIIIYWVIAAKRFDWQYNIKQTINQKTHTYRSRKLQIELLIIREYKANKRISESVCPSKQLR